MRHYVFAIRNRNFFSIIIIIIIITSSTSCVFFTGMILLMKNECENMTNIIAMKRCVWMNLRSRASGVLFSVVRLYQLRGRENETSSMLAVGGNISGNGKGSVKGILIDWFILTLVGQRAGVVLNALRLLQCHVVGGGADNDQYHRQNSGEEDKVH